MNAAAKEMEKGFQKLADQYKKRLAKQKRIDDNPWRSEKSKRKHRAATKEIKWAMRVSMNKMMQGWTQMIEKMEKVAEKTHSDTMKEMQIKGKEEKRDEE